MARSALISCSNSGPEILVFDLHTSESEYIMLDMWTCYLSLHLEFWMRPTSELVGGFQVDRIRNYIRIVKLV